MKKFYCCLAGLVILLSLGGCTSNKASSTGDTKGNSGADTTIEKSEEDSSTIESEYIKIEDELLVIELKEDEYDVKLQKDDITQTEMNQISSEIYTLWDDELNSLMERLPDKVDSDTMETIRQEESQWIADRNDQVEKAGAEFEGGSMRPTIENSTATDLTKARVYELSEYFK